MVYRKVGCLEQCWYIICFWMKEKCQNFKNKIQDIKKNWRNRT